MDVPTARVKASLYLRAVTAGITLVIQTGRRPVREEEGVCVCVKRNMAEIW